MKMKIGLGADHGGFVLKQELAKLLAGEGHDVVDFGAKVYDAGDDYPDFAIPLARAVSRAEVERGILLCGSGVGASVCANKIAGVRAALVHDHFSARQGVEDDHMNVLCMGGRTVGTAVAWDLVQTFLTARFSRAARHLRRLGKVRAVENEKRGITKGDHMKTILVALLVAGVTMSAGAADFIPGTQPANEIMPKASGPIKSQADAVTAPARIDREAAPAVNSKPLTGIVNVEESTKPGLPTNSDAAPVPANVVAAPAKKAEEAAPEKAAAPAVVPDQVLPLQDLVAFHEKEIESLKQLIAQWSMQIQTTIERRQDLEKTIESRARRLEELRQEGTKTSRAQAAQLNKEIARLKKDQSAIDRELKKQAKDLAKETQEASEDAEQTLKDTYQQTADKIQEFSRGSSWWSF